MYQLTDEQKAALIARYSGRFHAPLLSYGTVRDYCDSCDHLPELSSAQSDLKDLQRPWTVKAALGLLPPGSRLLEIGAGQPLVAALLAELGYDVTVVDPYDGSGGGPTDFDTFVQLYPNVRIIQSEFAPGLALLKPKSFDAIYSISVLEHIPEPGLGVVFKALGEYLKSHGKSLHSVDCVIHGENTAYHIEQCLRIARYQREIAGEASFRDEELLNLVNKADSDLETYYLSASGHNLWRAGAPYDTFPFRRVLSFQTAVEASSLPSEISPSHG